MAWNEPGNGGRDPWGNRQDEGPPDLDEAFKKLQNNLGKKVVCSLLNFNDIRGQDHCQKYNFA